LIGAGAVALAYKALSSSSSKEKTPKDVLLDPTGKSIELPVGISFGPDFLLHFDQGVADRIKKDLAFFHAGPIDRVGPKVWRVPLTWAGGKMLEPVDPTNAATVAEALSRIATSSLPEKPGDHPMLAVMGPWRMATPVPLYDTVGLLLLAVPDKETAASYASPAGGYAIISMPKS
jgi:hypothetical protein